MRSIIKTFLFISIGLYASADADTLLRLLDALDDSDDVQLVSANYEIADELMLRLAG